MIKFVLLSSMRTGSNLLNTMLNQFEEITMNGEAFNPNFVGLHPTISKKLTIERHDVDQRKNPLEFLEILHTSCPSSISGFHLFPNHSSTILEHILNDKEHKLLGLRRSIIPSYISLLEARQSNVWLSRENNHEKLMNLKPVMFDIEGFLTYKNIIDSFWSQIFQKTDKHIFHLWYADLKKTDKLNECANFLGVKYSKHFFEEKIKKQSAKNLCDRIINYDEVQKFADQNNLLHQLHN